MAADAVVDPDAPESGVWKWVKIGFFVVVAVGLIAIGTSTAGANGGLKLANALIAIVGGVLGAMVLFIGPAIAAIAVFLVFPAVQTVQGSFYNADLSKPVGFQNYVNLFTKDPDFKSTLVNTLLWTLIVPTVTVILGLLVATLTDKLNPVSEKYAKMFIFLPMAISLVGSAGIWKLVYDSSSGNIDPQTGELNRIGLLNAILKFFGFETQQFLINAPLNTFMLIIVMVWIQAGFAMTVLSAAKRHGIAIPHMIDAANRRRIV